MVDRQELFKAFKLMLNPYPSNNLDLNATIPKTSPTIIPMATTPTAIRDHTGATREQATWATAPTKAITRIKDISKAIIKVATTRATPQIIKAT